MEEGLSDFHSLEDEYRLLVDVHQTWNKGRILTQVGSKKWCACFILEQEERNLDDTRSLAMLECGIVGNQSVYPRMSRPS